MTPSEPAIDLSVNRPVPRRAAIAVLAIILVVALLPHSQAASQVLVWDSGSPLADTPTDEQRTLWKPVPGELFSQERDPAKAASDPGYYGREYAFTGSPIVENRYLLAIFLSNPGRVALFDKTQLPTGSGANNGTPLRKLIDIVPRLPNAQSATLGRVTVLRNAADEVMLEVSFSDQGSARASAIFSFDKTETLEIRPTEGTKGLSMQGAIEYGVVPGFIGDDLIYAASEFASASTLCAPAEHVLLAMLSGGDAELVFTWPRKSAAVSLGIGEAAQGGRSIRSVDFEGGSLCVTALRAPGLWHRETLRPAHLEKDVKLGWRPPFPARWKTLLNEAEVKTTFAFREGKTEIWRGVPGSYVYPAWIRDGDAFLHLGKKVPPKGDALIYFLEGMNTPPTVLTPVDIVKATLGRELAGTILDLEGRKLRTHHRRGGDGVHRACTCGCTEAIQAVFESGEEVAKKEQIRGALDDMMFFVQCHVDRIAEYRLFAAELSKSLQTRATAEPSLKPYLERLEGIARRIPEECDVQKENMKSPAYAQELMARTLALTAEKRPGNLKAYMELLKAWRDMGGAQDYVVAACHMTVRRLSQEAGYGCVETPAAVGLATEIRARCRQVLRHPDGYEIWSDY